MVEHRSYSALLQVVVTVEADAETDWEDIDARMLDAGTYTLLTPWETDVISVFVGAHFDGG
jgi:hypothetical protein